MKIYHRQRPGTRWKCVITASTQRQQKQCACVFLPTAALPQPAQVGIFKIFNFTVPNAKKRLLFIGLLSQQVGIEQSESSLSNFKKRVWKNPILQFCKFPSNDTPASPNPCPPCCRPLPPPCEMQACFFVGACHVLLLIASSWL